MGIESSAWAEGKEMSFSLARGAGKGPFSEKRSCVSLPETVLFFYKFRRPCRRRESRRVRAARDSVPSSTNERQPCAHKATLPWNVTAPYVG